VGLGLAALVLSALVHWDVMAPWSAGVVLALLFAKDLILFPYVRKSYETSEPHGGASLLGAVARVDRALTPEGWVRVGAERWRARAADEAHDLAAGEYVEVREIDNLVLIVEPVAALQGSAGGD